MESGGDEKTNKNKKKSQPNVKKQKCCYVRAAC